ncbi:MAG: hypothetical protein ACYC4N_27315 [Pirellulaceae bacterium]
MTLPSESCRVHGAAGHPAVGRVVFFRCTGEGVIDIQPAVALLARAAPGLSPQFVPSAALMTSDDSHSGLEGAVYLFELHAHD